MGWTKRLTREEAQQLYDTHGSVVGVAKALGVSHGTAHVWLRVAGVVLRTLSEAQQARSLRERAQREAGAAPRGRRGVRPVTREACRERRHWHGEVLLCTQTQDGVCGACTRGEHHARAEALTGRGEVGLASVRGGRTGIWHPPE